MHERAAARPAKRSGAGVTMQMFAGGTSRSTKVNYQVILVRRQSGGTFTARLEDAIPALRDTRYEYLAVFGWRAKFRKRTATLLDAAATVSNKDLPPELAIVEFEIQNRMWDFGKAPDDPDHGQVVGRFIHRVTGLRGASGGAGASNAVGHL
jgi:hypothetical protein